MGVLKIRNPDGSIKTIATMKGDKGDGVPDGGTVGQVVKKTADGTEWGDVTTKVSAVFQNEDTSVKSCAITKKGLYEVTFFCSTSNWSDAPPASTYNIANKCLMSLSDLSEKQTQEFRIGSYIANGLIGTTEHPFRYDRLAYITYENQTLTSEYKHVVVSDSLQENYVSIEPNRSYLAEVRLIIPYD